MAGMNAYRAAITLSLVVVMCTVPAVPPQDSGAWPAGRELMKPGAIYSKRC